MSSRVLIQGESIAAYCCANLLRRARISVSHQKTSRPKLSAIMIGESTQRLLGDIFPEAKLFDSLTRINKRIVLWGGAREAVTVPHSAVVVSEERLLRSIEPFIENPSNEQHDFFEWKIASSRPLPEVSDELQFGTRVANASSVKVKPGFDDQASWLESLPGGWLFLLPNSEATWLLSVGDSVESLLTESRLIAKQILRVENSGARFQCHPRIASLFCGPKWMACGSAALGFDPLCGDGSGYAAREAILASAVIAAAEQGLPADDLIAHYRSRVLAGFEKHLCVCLDLYNSGHSGPWWDEQISASQNGLDWCRRQRAGLSAFKYRLVGFSLEPV